MEEGILVHPQTVHITPEVPTELLLDIVASRGAKSSVKVSQVAEASGSKHSISSADVADYLKANGTTRMKDLCEALNCDAETIKELSGQDFEVANAGWVKLLDKGGEA